MRLYITMSMQSLLPKSKVVKKSVKEALNLQDL
jgi:hypothetical protein